MGMLCNLGRFRWAAACFVSLMFLMARCVPAQQTSTAPPPSFVLTLGSSETLAVPSLSFGGAAQCDLRGDAYFGITGRSYGERLVLRLSADGRDATPFLFPKDLDNNAEWHFSVSPDGDVYALASEESSDGSNTLVRFSDSGDELGRTVLHLPEGFLVNSFAVQSDGRTIVQGEVPVPPVATPDNSKKETASSPRVTPTTVLLDPNGKPVVVKKSAELSLSEGSQSVVAAGKNGAFLDVQGATLKVYDLTGNLAQSFKLTKPHDDSKAAKVQYIDGQIAIDFTRLDPLRRVVVPKHPELKVGPLESEWAIVNLADGATTGFYKLPDDFHGTSLCYLGRHEFLNFSVQNRQPIFIDATMP